MQSGPAGGEDQPMQGEEREDRARARVAEGSLSGRGEADCPANRGASRRSGKEPPGAERERAREGEADECARGGGSGKDEGKERSRHVCHGGKNSVCR